MIEGIRELQTDDSDHQSFSHSFNDAVHTWCLEVKEVTVNLSPGVPGVTGQIQPARQPYKAKHKIPIILFSSGAVKLEAENSNFISDCMLHQDKYFSYTNTR